MESVASVEAEAGPAREILSRVQLRWFALAVPILLFVYAVAMEIAIESYVNAISRGSVATPPHSSAWVLWPPLLAAGVCIAILAAPRFGLIGGPSEALSAARSLLLVVSVFVVMGVAVMAGLWAARDSDAVPARVVVVASALAFVLWLWLQRVSLTGPMIALIVVASLVTAVALDGVSNFSGWQDPDVAFLLLVSFCLALLLCSIALLTSRGRSVLGYVSENWREASKKGTLFVPVAVIAVVITVLSSETWVLIGRLPLTTVLLLCALAFATALALGAGSMSGTELAVLIAVVFLASAAALLILCLTLVPSESMMPALWEGAQVAELTPVALSEWTREVYLPVAVRMALLLASTVVVAAVDAIGVVPPSSTSADV